MYTYQICVVKSHKSYSQVGYKFIYLLYVIKYTVKTSFLSAQHGKMYSCITSLPAICMYIRSDVCPDLNCASTVYYTFNLILSKKKKQKQFDITVNNLQHSEDYFR